MRHEIVVSMLPSDFFKKSLTILAGEASFLRDLVSATTLQLRDGIANGRMWQLDAAPG